MRDLRVGVDAVGRGVVIGDTISVPGDVLHRAHPFVRRDVREHDAADHVTDRPHAVRGRMQVLVDDDASAVELDAGFFRVETLRVGHAPDREQHLVGIHSATLGAGREAHLQRAVLLDDLGDLAVGVDLAA